MKKRINKFCTAARERGVKLQCVCVRVSSLLPPSSHFRNALRDNPLLLPRACLNRACVLDLSKEEEGGICLQSSPFSSLTSFSSSRDTC